MSDISTANPKLMATLASWLRDQPDLLVLFRFSAAAGLREYELCSSLDTLASRIAGLRERTSVTAFRGPQLPLRGEVDDAFIALCMRSIKDGKPWVLLETARLTRGWFHHCDGMSLESLRLELEESRGISVAVGYQPNWLEDNDSLIAAIVPDEDGVVRAGIY